MAIPLQELLDRFDLLVDKYESPYFTDDEKVRWLNMAQESVVKDLYYNRTADKASNGELLLKYEKNEEIASYLQSLVFNIPNAIPTPITAPGQLSLADVVAQIALVGGAGRDVMFPIELWLKDPASPVGEPYISSKFLRQNDRYPFQDNAFLEPAPCRPYYEIVRGRYNVLPDNVLFNYKMAVLATPLPMSITGPVNCELPYALAGDIVNRAVELSGIGIRDNMLYETSTLESTRKQP